MGVDFGKFARTGDAAKKLENAGTRVKTASGSTSAQGMPKLGENQATKSSIFGSSAGANSTVSTEKFIESLSGKSVDEMSATEKAQYNYLATFADVNGDGKISQEEFNNIAGLDGNDEQFDASDIDALYAELGVPSDASIKELMDAIDGVFKDEESKAAAKEAVKDLDPKQVPTGNSGAKLNADGEYELTVETYRGGKVQQGEEGEMRYPNGSMWGIVTNAYPEVPEGQKEQVYEYIAELNGWDGGWQNHVLHTGDNVKMPILEYDENGNITGYKNAVEIKEEPKTEETGKSGSTGATGGTSGTGSTGATGGTSGTGSTGATGGTSGTGSTSGASKPTSTPATTAPASSTPTTANADYSELLDWVDTAVDKYGAGPNQLTKLLNDIDAGGYNLKDFVAAYDKAHAGGKTFFEVFSGYDINKDPDLTQRVVDSFIESYGGFENPELQAYLDKMCTDSEGYISVQNAPSFIAQQIYSETYTKICESCAKDPTGETTFYDFEYQCSQFDPDTYKGLQGVVKAKEEYEANVAIMKEFEELYNEYKDNKEAMNLDVGFRNYTQGKDKSKSVAKIMKDFNKQGMSDGGYLGYMTNMEEYKNAIAVLKEYKSIMG